MESIGERAATKYAMEALSEALRMELAGTDIYISTIISVVSTILYYGSFIILV